VIQTTLDFCARFPSHRRADANPAELRRQRFSAANILINISAQWAEFTVAGDVSGKSVLASI
jgi:hypothetical protein